MTDKLFDSFGKRGRPRKYKRAYMISLYISSEFLEQLDEVRGHHSRGEFLMLLLKNFDKESLEAYKQLLSLRKKIEKMKKELRKLRAENKELRKKIKELPIYQEFLEFKQKVISWIQDKKNPEEYPFYWELRSEYLRKWVNVFNDKELNRIFRTDTEPVPNH